MTPVSNDTLRYYAANAAEFAAGTINVDFSATQQRFLKYLPDGAAILDFGCGAGRDTKAFLNLGYSVEAIDGSTELCRLATEYTGIEVRHMYFHELDACGRYDGIWACASVLHLRRVELPDVFRRMARALKPKGILYVSFKYGDFSGERNGRFFTDMNEQSFDTLLQETNEFKIQDIWVSSDVRPGRGEERWLNCILCKK